MKYLVLFSLIVSSFLGYSQKPVEIKVTEGSESLGGSTNNALTVTIFEATAKEIEKALKSELKKAKAKVTIKKEIFADDATLAALGTNSADIYAKIMEAGDKKSNLIVAVDLGGAFLSSAEHKDKFEAFKAYLYGFAVNTTKDALAGQAKEATKVQEGMEKDLQRLKDQKTSLEKLIKDSEAKIEQAKKDIQTNGENQVKKEKEITTQKGVVTQLEEREKAVK